MFNILCKYLPSIESEYFGQRNWGHKRTIFWLSSWFYTRVHTHTHTPDDFTGHPKRCSAQLARGASLATRSRWADRSERKREPPTCVHSNPFTIFIHPIRNLQKRNQEQDRGDHRKPLPGAWVETHPPDGVQTGRTWKGATVFCPSVQSSPSTLSRQPACLSAV